MSRRYPDQCCVLSAVLSCPACGQPQNCFSKGSEKFFRAFCLSVRNTNSGAILLLCQMDNHPSRLHLKWVLSMIWMNLFTYLYWFIEKRPGQKPKQKNWFAQNLEHFYALTASTCLSNRNGIQFIVYRICIAQCFAGNCAIWLANSRISFKACFVVVLCRRPATTAMMTGMFLIRKILYGEPTEKKKCSP